VLGARCVVEEDNVLDHGARVNPGVRVPRGIIGF
jgi:acetyltransferase-like isoleucine patch superfamily enzyme